MPKRRPTSLPPDMLRVLRQNGHDSDCALTALGTLWGWDRDEALLVCGAVQPAVLHAGMDDDEISAVLDAGRFKYQILKPGKYDLYEATGALSVAFRRGKDQHMVILWEGGRIIDGNGEHWLDCADYMRYHKCKPGNLIVRLD